MPFIPEIGVSGKGYIYVQWFSDKGSISGLGGGLNPFPVFLAAARDGVAFFAEKSVNFRQWYFGIVLDMLRQNKAE